MQGKSAGFPVLKMAITLAFFQAAVICLVSWTAVKMAANQVTTLFFEVFQ